MEKKIIIISGSEIRHRFLSAYLAKEKKIKILLSLQEKVKKLKDNNDLKKYNIFKKHLKDRDIIVFLFVFVYSPSRSLFISVREYWV